MSEQFVKKIGRWEFGDRQAKQLLTLLQGLVVARGDRKCLNDYHYNCLQLNTEVLNRGISEVVDMIHFELSPRFGLVDPLIEQILCQFAKEIEVSSALDSLYVESLTNTLVIHLLHHYGTGRLQIHQYKDGLSKHQLCRAIDYIESQLDREIKLADLAQLLGISQYYFCRVFRQSMGISPYQYVIQQRVERAKILLQRSKPMTIADIALECGFTNQSSLCKHFRNLTGVTPKTYSALRCYEEQ